MGGDPSAARRFRRLTVRVQVEIASAARQLLCRATATTLGAGGLFVATRAPLDEGCALLLRFALPGSPNRHEIPGRVVWTNRPEDGNPHEPGMGIEFSDRLAASGLARELDALARGRC